MRNPSKIIRFILSIFLFSIVTVSCIDRLDFVGNTNEGELVIYGLLTDIDGKQVVNISRTSSSALAPRGVPNAIVTLLVDSGERIEYFNVGTGDYELTGFKAVDGKSYAVEVILEDQTYRSDFEKMPSIVAEDKLSFTFGNEPFRTESTEPVFTLFNQTKLPETSEQVFLRWQVEETYLWERTWLPCIGLCPPPPDNCFISDIVQPERINLFDGSNTNTRNSSFVLGQRSVDNSFISIFYLTVTQLSINREAYNYWERIKIIISNQGSLFDIPPAPVFGNIFNTKNPEERVLGYFEVAKAKITRISTNRGDVPFFLQRPCEFVVGKPAEDYAAECVKCEERAKGRRWTNTEPSWWNDN